MNLLTDPFVSGLLVYALASLILIRFCYFEYSKNRAHGAAFLLFGAGVFLVTSQLHSADVSMGFAFGLFAVFSMLRYRTESMNIKDMTYLFLTIAMALLCAVSNMGIVKLAMICGFMCLLAYTLEKNLLFPMQQDMTLTYEKIENLHKNKRAELLKDLTQRTGLNIQHVEILNMDFMRDSAVLKLHFTPTNESTKSEEGPDTDSSYSETFTNNLVNNTSNMESAQHNLSKLDKLEADRS